MTDKYIFVTGAPGSKWSSVVKNIYFSADIDHSDYTNERTYCHDKDAPHEIMHFGAYFDPGMEFGNEFYRLNDFEKQEAEAEFNRPFSGTGKRIIKSHTIAHHLDYIKENWPECSIVLIHRDNDNCLKTWVKAGGADIGYPNYKYFAESMVDHIRRQNQDILDFINRKNGIFNIMNNLDLCDALGIAYPSDEYRQDYNWTEVKVAVL